MLKFRVLTALVLAPLALAAIWLLPTAGIALAFAAILVLGTIEWARLIGLERPGAQALYVLGLLLLFGLGWIFYRSELSKVPVFLLSAVWWLAAMHWLQRFGRNDRAAPPSPLLAGILGYVVMWFAWFSLVTLHGLSAGAYFVTLLVLVVWGADIGAYFAGRAFGRRKLAPRVSPGKTWEGVAGGLALALAAGVVLHLVVGPAWPPLYVLLPLLGATVLFSIVGDLFESMVKRQYGAKDSGNLLPGHGGVLDRIDSLTAAAPIFVMGLLWWRMTP